MAKITKLNDNGTELYPITKQSAVYNDSGEALSTTLTKKADLVSGTVPASQLPTTSVAKGGTGATTAADARTNLGITPANIGAAASSHNQAASTITSGTLSSDRLPTVPVTKGGTGATDAATARSNLGITLSNLGAAASSHTHTKSQISDFPSSMPASDVYSWAKASSKPSYTASEVGASATGHKHTKSEITDFPSSMTPSAHNQAASTITAGTLGGQVVANASAVSNLGTAQVRNIYAGTTDLTPGVSTLATGTIYLVYEP